MILEGFSYLSALPNPLPVRYPGGAAGAAIALVIKDGVLCAVVVGDGGDFYVDEVAILRAVPRPGDDLRMAVGWAVETPEWRALAAARRDAR